MQLTHPLTLLALSSLAAVGQTTEAGIKVDLTKPGHRLSPLLTGVCIEDVNHEIYGGLYSQMLFGESFQEPAATVPPRGFDGYGGTWSVQDGELHGSAGEGPKLVSQSAAHSDGETGVEVFFADPTPGNAGLILRVAAAGTGADAFDGYEISLDPAGGLLHVGRHRHNWKPLSDTPCAVPTGRWIALVARLHGHRLEVLVDGRSVVQLDDPDPLPGGRVGLRQWQRSARYRNLWTTAGEARQALPLEPTPPTAAVSGMWRLAQKGTAAGSCALVRQAPFVGQQSQQLTFAAGEGEWGVENRGLNRWGLHFHGLRPYEGVVWARAEQAVALTAAIERSDGTAWAEAPLAVPAGDWQRLTFTLTPGRTIEGGRFTLKLKAPGSVTLGYAALQPGEWGRFRGLPVRRDVAEAMVSQGFRVVRYGGSMVNHAEYRWKAMTGPRDRRQPCHGTWYPYSTHGWGIPDFLALCQAAGWEAIPAVNTGETAQDLLDLLEYCNGPADSPWGARRVADGFTRPLGLKFLEFGNEERVDDAFVARFAPVATALWAKDPQLVLVVGDFVYGQPLADPFHFGGAASGITTLAAHQQILKLAKAAGGEVWFDVHVGTDGPGLDGTVAALPSYIDAIDALAAGAKAKVAVFELNAGNHAQRRALANAVAIQRAERDGRLAVVTSANGLQVDGHNDNDWNQGLLFMNQSQVWLQPPGWVSQLLSNAWLPLSVPCEATGGLDVSARRSEDGRTLVLSVVNPGATSRTTRIELAGIAPTRPDARVEELSAPLDAVNTALEPGRVQPKRFEWRIGALYTFAANSLTVLRIE